MLAAQGDFSGTATGYYGAQTRSRRSLNFKPRTTIDQLGVVGPSTRSALNQIENATALQTAALQALAIANMTLSQLQAEAQTLESELTQILNRITQLSGTIEI